MSSPPVPDPYLALGLTKDADQAQIKSVYRKLVLKCHPDKVTDESKKQEASDNFHKIQQAYEILSDEDRRGKYDASVRLAALRREILHRQQAPPPLQTDFKSSYSHPPPMTRTATWSPRSELPRAYDDDYPEPPLSARPSRRTSYSEKEHRKYPKSESERRASVKSSEKSSHHDRKMYTDKDRKKERESKTYQRAYVKEHSDESDLEVPRTRSRNLENSREAGRTRERVRERERERGRDFYSQPRDLSDSESGDEYHRQHQTRQMNHVKDYMQRSNHNARFDDRDKRRPPFFSRNSTLDEIRESDGTRRSSVANNGRDKHYVSEKPERTRHNSVPTLNSAETFVRPPLGKSHTLPVEVLTSEKKSKPARTLYYEVAEDGGPTLRRSESETHTQSRRRQNTPRESSKLSQHFEYEYGLPTPGASPPRDHKIRSYRADDDNHYDRDVSPRDNERRRRPESPPPKSRTNGSRHGPVSPTKLTTVKIVPPKDEPQYASNFTEAPKSLRSPHLSPTRSMSSQTLFCEVKDDSRSKSSRLRDYGESDVLYTVKDFEPVPKMRTGSRRNSARPPTSRGHSYTGIV